jgi:hypothetical protein
VGVQEFRWDKGGSISAGIIILSMEKKQKPSIGTGLFVHQRIISAIKTVEFVGNRVSYIGLRER